MLTLLGLSSSKVFVFNGDNVFDGYFEVGLDGIKKNVISGQDDVDVAKPVVVDDTEISFGASIEKVKKKDGSFVSTVFVMYLKYTANENKIIYLPGSSNMNQISTGDRIAYAGPEYPLRIPMWVNTDKQVHFAVHQDDILKQLEQLYENEEFLNDFVMPWKKIPMESYNEKISLPKLRELIASNVNIKDRIGTLEKEQTVADYKIPLQSPDPLITQNKINEIHQKHMEKIQVIGPNEQIYLDIVTKEENEWEAKNGKIPLDTLKESLPNLDYPSNSEHSVVQAIQATLIKDISEIISPSNQELPNYYSTLGEMTVAVFQKYLDQLLQGENNIFFQIYEDDIKNNNGFLNTNDKVTAWEMMENYMRQKFNNELDFSWYPELLELLTQLDILEEKYSTAISNDSNMDPVSKNMKIVIKWKISSIQSDLKSPFKEYTNTQKSELYDSLHIYCDKAFGKREGHKTFETKIWEKVQLYSKGIIHLLALAGNLNSSYYLDHSNEINMFEITNNPDVKVEPTKSTKRKKKKTKDDLIIRVII